MRIPKVKTKDLITVSDLDRGEIMDIFNLTANLKKEAARERHPDFLMKKSLAMIFEKSSTRTRVSFETGVTQLGGHALFLDGNDIQIKRGESIVDTAKVLSRYVDGIMIRTFSHDNVVELAKSATVPVINGLSDEHHPCQALADFFTIYEREGGFKGIQMAYIGDGNNVANSLIQCAAILGVNMHVACPKQYEPDQYVVDDARKVAARAGSEVVITRDPEAAVKNANYIYTDVWISMGEEKKAAVKKKALAKYKITKELLSKGRADSKVMHCLPAHREEEIEGDVLDSGRSIVFDEAENRLHVQKAVMCALMARK
ncbi:MAG TPA: ornithine carbamoyltransferase [Spirochaetota bacterium]|nr:ornithine carbamoyltransferase [Spirochaetota bacterium]HPC42966.1 ornithine carbamoyltransferase [Spirochaetota bacterium]HPL18567.1 ornithine carbamoyltransferase [Spirochaetota bacterium]HQF10065.1 ornithine carbamoyltransferase [Spirochaetota bacterium]HQH98805.1 ornithine carbamoyltransferase [Spirochaetota bacterium]